MKHVYLLLLSLCCTNTVTAAHYLDRYRPAKVYTLDTLPTAEAEDALGTIAKPELGPPKVVIGAQPFTGKAIDFQGVGCFVEYPVEGSLFDSGDIEATTGLTVSFWIRAGDKIKPGNQRVMGAGSLIDLAADKSGTLSLFLLNNNVRTRQKGGTITDDAWHHIAVAADFREKYQNLAVYVDGALNGITDVVFDTSYKLRERDTIRIGARSSGGHQSHCVLDDIAIFNRPLPASEVIEIVKGPLWIGPELEAYGERPLKLHAVTPLGVPVFWSKASGPGEVLFENAREADTKCVFKAPGGYQLRLQIEGYPDQTLKVTAHPAAPPVVEAGDAIHLGSVAVGVSLDGDISVPGVATNDQAVCRWTKVSGPGQVKFQSAHAPRTHVKFGKDGLYELKFVAEYDGLFGEDTVQVLVGAASNAHYALKLDPLYLIGMDVPATNEPTGVTELSGNTGAYMDEAKGALPQMILGARPFTGHAFDFSQSPRCVCVINRFNVAELGRLDRADGMSVGFWFKDEDYVRSNNRLAVFSNIDIVADHWGTDRGGLGLSVAGAMITAQHRDAGHLMDGMWHHAVLTVDYRSQADNVRLYIDGNADTVVSHAFSEDFYQNGAARTHYWGARGPNSNYAFKGCLDDVIVFDRALTPEEIGYLFHGPSEADLKVVTKAPMSVHAGKGQIHRMPVKTVRLNAVSDESTARFRWRLISGPGDVRFTAPEASSTEVQFEPIDRARVSNPKYCHYVFRVLADSEQRRGGRDDVEVVFYDSDAPKTRKFSKTPPSGEHPRILFAEEDLPELRYAAKTNPYAIRGLANLKDMYTRGILNVNSAIGRCVADLAAGKKEVNIRPHLNHMSDLYSGVRGHGGLYGQLQGAAYVALMEEDTETLKMLAAAVSNLAKEHYTFYRPEYPNQLAHDASGSLGLAYDWLHDSMTPGQRMPVRRLLSRMTMWRHPMGTGLVDADNSTNWRGFHDHIVIASLAIEGEQGYDPGVYEQGLRRIRRFMTQYGTFPSGYAHEGWGYYSFGMINASPLMLAIARRDENLFETTSFYPMLQAMFRSLVPGQDWVFSHGDTVAGRLSDPPAHVWIGRYAFPDDPVAAALCRTLADNAMSAQDQRPVDLRFAMFAQPKKDMSPQQAAEHTAIPLTLFCPNKGYVNTRSDWSDDALLLSYRCRMDKYYLGHMHPDVNSFELFALGREWFSDPGKFSIQNDMHQTILIDGVGGGGSTAVWTWPSLPGRFIEFIDTESATGGTGDARDFYSYSYRVPESVNLTPELQQDFSFEEVKGGPIWEDFVYAEVDRLPFWRKYFLSDPKGENGLFTHNPVQRAIRTVVLVRGQHPFVVISDDYRKDDKVRNYTWVANPRPDTVEQVSAKGTDLVLRHKEDSGARMLVRVLQAEGLAGAPQLLDHPKGLSCFDEKMTPVVIHAKAVNPEFKVMLYPFREEGPMPSVRWIDKGKRAEVVTGNERRIITFADTPDDKGRIVVND